MCSLINKRLLLTAYAYLFIMEQQKGQQGSEALQMFDSLKWKLFPDAAKKALQVQKKGLNQARMEKADLKPVVKEEAKKEEEQSGGKKKKKGKKNNKRKEGESAKQHKGSSSRNEALKALDQKSRQENQSELSPEQLNLSNEALKALDQKSRQENQSAASGDSAQIITPIAKPVGNAVGNAPQSKSSTTNAQARVIQPSQSSPISIKRQQQQAEVIQANQTYPTGFEEGDVVKMLPLSNSAYDNGCCVTVGGQLQNIHGTVELAYTTMQGEWLSVRFAGSKWDGAIRMDPKCLQKVSSARKNVRPRL